VAVIVTSSFIYISSVKYIRHALPLSILLVGIWGAGLAQVWWTLSDLIARIPARRWLQRLPEVVVLVLGLSFILIAVDGVQAMRQRFRLQPTQQALWQWADVNVPLDGRVLMLRSSSLGGTWNRPWSGYDGTKPFDWWFVEDDANLNTPTEYVERGIAYFAVTPDDRQSWADTPARQTFVDQLVLLKTIAATPDTSGPPIEFYRMLPPAYEADITYDDRIALVGYDLNANRLKPGESLLFRPYWRALQSPTNNYSMFVHLYPLEERSQIIGQHDSAPSSPGRLTLTWTDPNELVIGADVSLLIPADVPPGEYEMALGLYDFTSGQRLLTDQGTDAFTLAVEVTN
jgi:hypothetical protein